MEERQGESCNYFFDSGKYLRIYTRFRFTKLWLSILVLIIIIIIIIGKWLNWKRKEGRWSLSLRNFVTPATAHILASFMHKVYYKLHVLKKT